MSQEEVVLFVTSPRPLPGQAAAHADAPPLSRPLSALKEEWVVTVNQVLALVAATDAEASSGSFTLEELSVRLGFTAKGKLAFIAEAGVEASVEITFKRR